MKCSTCGASAFVIRTIEENPYHVTRTYRCNAGHESCTHEVLPGGVSKRDLAAAERGAAKRAELFERNQAILKDLSTMSAEHLGKKWKLTGARIRQLRDTVPVQQRKEQPDEPANTRIHRLQG